MESKASPKLAPWSRRGFSCSLLLGLAWPWTAHARQENKEAAASSYQSFTPYDFGAKGDGVADDTKACNAAAARAQETQGELLFPEGTFAISDYVVVRNGVRRVTGRGGVIRCVNAKNDAGLLLASSAAGRYDAVKNCTVEGLRIDCNGGRTARTNAIYGQNVSDCEIVNNHIFGLVNGYGVLVRVLAKGGSQSSGNTIRGNRIDADTGEKPACWGITVDAELAFDGASANAPEEWRSRFMAGRPAHPTENHLIEENRVTGGYYGLSLSGVRRCIARRNLFALNVRNVSAQNGCTGNLIEDNECVDSISSSVHLAYGSSENRVLRNRITTRRAKGEGLLQAYVGSASNVFEGNSVEATEQASPMYFVYTGVHADRNQFIGNQLAGKCSRAYVAVESGFNPASTDPTHRTAGLRPDAGHMAGRGMSGVVISGNRIVAASGVPAIYLAQISDDRGAYPLKECIVKNNVVRVPPEGICLKLVENTEGQLSDLVFENNQFPPDARERQFQIPRGAAHFRTLADNINLRVR
jgi:hypothetical protein